MYICLCNALTDKQVKQLVAANGFYRLVDVYEACGCKVECGQCVRAMLRLVREQARLPEKGIQSAA